MVQCVSKALFASIAPPAIVWRDIWTLLFMAIDDDLHALFEARRESFEVFVEQPTNANLHRIVEELANILYTISLDKEGGKRNLIGLIMDKVESSARFVSLFPHATHPAIYDELIADGATSVIRTEAEDVHRAHITNFDAYEAAVREERRFLIDVIREAWYSKMCKPFTFHA